MSVNRYCGNPEPHDSHGWSTEANAFGWRDSCYCFGVANMGGILTVALNDVERCRRLVESAQAELDSALSVAREIAKANHDRRQQEFYGFPEEDDDDDVP